MSLHVTVVCTIDLHWRISPNLDRPMDTITDFLKVDVFAADTCGATCLFLSQLAHRHIIIRSISGCGSI